MEEKMVRTNVAEKKESLMISFWGDVHMLSGV